MGPNNALARKAGLNAGGYWELDYEQKCYEGGFLPRLSTVTYTQPAACIVAALHD